VEPALEHYDVGRVQSVESARSGLMHGTWIVTADAGRFVLQRLHHKLATPEIIADYQAVTEHLAARGVPAPRLVPTRAGAPVAQVDDRWWRLSTFVPGDTRERVASAEEAEEGARALGRFHRVMADIRHDFGSQHPLHDTAGHLERLHAAAADPAYAPWRGPIEGEIATVLGRLGGMLLPDGLPLRVVHGDPKISNVLFRDGHAIGLIDLDTCNRHTVLVDLGDAIRSWCRDGAEDEKQRFHPARFEAILRGYAAEGPALTAAEVAALPQAGPMITLELASRFLRDALEDHYFAWDAARYPDRRSHNVARARGMLFLAQDMEAHAEACRELVARYFPAV
jgi:Ser/Thr protein kinase RdoA (MazF antagonist)